MRNAVLIGSVLMFCGLTTLSAHADESWPVPRAFLVAQRWPAPKVVQLEPTPAKTADASAEWMPAPKVVRQKSVLKVPTKKPVPPAAPASACSDGSCSSSSSGYSRPLLLRSWRR